MKILWGLLFLFVVTSSQIAYFRYERPVQSASSNSQHYVVVNEPVWEHAAAGLQDLRIYSGDKEIPYALTVENAPSETDQKALRILQPGTVLGKTQFLLDMHEVPEYDRVTLSLAAQNFVAHAHVEGQDDPHGNHWSALGTTTVYDLSDEKLGGNSTLQVPLSTFKFLRVTIDGPIKPSDVMQAVGNTVASGAIAWHDINSEPRREEQSRESVFTFSVSKNVPIERVNFALAGHQENFSRDVRIQGDNEQEIGFGKITVIHLQRNAQKIDIEETSVSLSRPRSGKYRVIIENGDDAPLRITNARLQQYERRLYFDSPVVTQLSLYYGDEKLVKPVYDYSKLFHKDPTASPLQLGAEVLNKIYTGRPDDRPWSERHPGILWVAIIGAVALLGFLAFSSMKTASR